MRVGNGKYMYFRIMMAQTNEVYYERLKANSENVVFLMKHMRAGKKGRIIVSRVKKIC